MIPAAVLEDEVKVLVAGDVNMLADPADAPKVWLIAEAFVPGRGVDSSALTKATYAGSAAKSATAGAQQAFTDPTGFKQAVQLNAPAGGWVWEATATPAAPETIFGYTVTNQAETVTYGSDLLPEPEVIELIGQAVSIPAIRMEVPLGVWESGD